MKTRLQDGEHLIDILNSGSKEDGISCCSLQSIEPDHLITESPKESTLSLFSITSGTFFITNKRIIFEPPSVLSYQNHFFYHDDILTTHGKNGSYLKLSAGTLNIVPAYPVKWINTKPMEEYFLYNRISYGGDLSDKLNSMFYQNPEGRIENYKNVKKLKEEKELNERLQKEEERIQREIAKAKQHEKLLEFDEAAEIYKALKMDDELIRIRKLKSEQGAVKISQKVVHGDEITRTEIKDSVVSKSSIGAGGKSKAEQIKEIKELLDSGAIDKDDYEKMKREIIG